MVNREKKAARKRRQNKKAIEAFRRRNPGPSLIEWAENRRKAREAAR